MNTPRAEASTPSTIHAEPDWSINTLLAQRVQRSGERTMIERKVDGDWRRVSAAAFDREVAAVAKGLIALGVEPGDRVAIMSRTRYEWTVLDFAAWAAAAVPVPIYETSSAEQVGWILADAGVRLAVVENSGHAERVSAAASGQNMIAAPLVIDDGALAALTEAGADVDDAELARRRAIPQLDALATIIYTSGTTGRPKGAELTHGNFVTLALNGVEGFEDVCAAPGSRTVLFMPLAHVFARYIEVLIVPSGAVLGHTPDPADLLSDLATFKPTFILAVPRVFERVYNGAEQKAGHGLKRTIFRWSAKASSAWSSAMDDPAGPSLLLKVQHAVADRLVLGKLRAALGGRAKYAVSGGAPLGARLGHFYRGLGLQVLEGYGLTETTSVTAVNLPGNVKIGTVGPPFPGSSMRIAPDGEILVKGPHVFRGYRGDEDATKEAFTDGWFRTGDLGALDEDGYLTITGRVKEIIVTAGGKNVAPAVLEDRMRSHPLVSQCIVVGDARPFIAALVTLDAQMLPGWLANHGQPDLSVAEATTNPAVRASIQKAVDRANEAVSTAESIRAFTLLDVDFTEAGGHLTPSMKVRRKQVLADYEAAVDKLYADAAAARARR